MLEFFQKNTLFSIERPLPELLYQANNVILIIIIIVPSEQKKCLSFASLVGRVKRRNIGLKTKNPNSAKKETSGPQNSSHWLQFFQAGRDWKNWGSQSGLRLCLLSDSRSEQKCKQNCGWCFISWGETNPAKAPRLLGCRSKDSGIAAWNFILKDMTWCWGASPSPRGRTVMRAESVTETDLYLSSGHQKY